MRQDHLKLAYDLGAQAALEDLGLTKSAGILDALKRLLRVAPEAETAVLNTVMKNPYKIPRPGSMRETFLNNMTDAQLAELSVSTPPLRTLRPSLKRYSRGTIDNGPY
jgi:hypothetical protein